MHTVKEELLSQQRNAGNRGDESSPTLPACIVRGQSLLPPTGSPALQQLNFSVGAYPLPSLFNCTGTYR
jgi:hypothetical protein